MRPKIEHLDKNDPEQIAEYERGFYEAFLPMSNPGIRALWIWDDENRRLRTVIPYDHQEIFVMRNQEGKITSGLAFNMNLEHFQSGAYGFDKPSTDHAWAETLTTFADPGNMLHCFEYGRQFLLDNGGTCSYATCAEKILPLYLRVGAEVMGRSETNGQVRYFLKFPLNRPYYVYK